ncbi:MAG: YbhB/YbcL family Raf kinase inhibitor-like protein, partial [Kiritimatiellia bacterium]
KVKTDLLAALADYLAADTAVGARTCTNAALLHLVNFDPDDAQAQADRNQARSWALKVQGSLNGTAFELDVDPAIDPAGKQQVLLSKFFDAPYITTNKLPLNLTGTLDFPQWSVFPDPTFNGIFTNMTNDKLDKYLRWDSLPPVAPATLNGLTLQLEDEWGRSVAVSFGDGTYVQDGNDADPGQVGTYTYVTNGAEAQLNMICTAPPSAVGTARTMSLTFARHDEGTFVAGVTDDEVRGSFFTHRPTDVAPATLAGRNMLVKASDIPTLVAFNSSGNGLTQLAFGESFSGHDTYAYMKMGPAGGLLVVTNGTDVTYVVLMFGSTHAGSMWPVSYNEADKSGAPGAPAVNTAAPVAAYDFSFVGSLSVSSSRFSEGGAIPKRCALNYYESDDALRNYSPPLAWEAGPAGTKSYALLMYGSDGYAHWNVYNLPTTERYLLEDAGELGYEELSNGGRQGYNNNWQFGYMGPSAISGETNDYVYTIYALDTAELELDSWELYWYGPQAWLVQSALAGHVLGFGMLTGTYSGPATPVVAITSPTDAQRIVSTNSEIRLTGTANDVVSMVYLQVNESGWQGVGTGTGAWRSKVRLSAGLNTVQAYGQDRFGNQSSIATISCTYVELAPLAVYKTGLGTVGIYTNNQPLEIGATYTLTATPAEGFGLQNWTTDGVVVGTALSITFTMRPNLALCANFKRQGDLTPDGISALASFFDENGEHALDPECLATAARDFGLASAADPNNYTNLIYHAVAILLNVINDPSIRSQAEAYGINLHNLLAPTMDFPTNGAPAVNESIDVFAAAVLPAVSNALIELHLIPESWTGMVEVTSADFPSLVQDESLWIDNGDVIAMKAACEGFRAWVALLKAYSLNVDWYRLRDPLPTVQRAITVDGSTNDWAGVPVSLLSYDGAITQRISVAMDGDRIALLADQSEPFGDSADYRWSFGLRLQNNTPFASDVDRLVDVYVYRYGDGRWWLEIAREGEYIDYGLLDYENFAAINGVLEIKLPQLEGIEASSQITLDHLWQFYLDTVYYYSEEIEILIPDDVPLTVLRANNPDFLSRVRDTTSMANAKTNLQNFATYYLQADTLITNRTAASAALLHMINIDSAETENERVALRTVATEIQSSLAGETVKLTKYPDIE